MSVWLKRIVMSSADIANFILSFGGVRMSEVYRLNSVGESISPYGTPVLIVACFNFMYVVVQYVLFASPDVI